MVRDTTGSNKRYYWLKLKDDFFRQKEIKQLRKIAGGDSFTIIYLKMLLCSLKDEGKLYYEGVEDDFVSELALDIDEDVENVKVTVAFLMAKGLLVQCNDTEYNLITAGEMTGSEGYSAERVRRFRSKQQLALQCNADVTTSNNFVTQSKSIEKEIDKDKEKYKRRFTKPTLEEVEAYCRERNKGVDAQRWFDYYSSNGWKVGKNPMKDWKAAVRTWERSEPKQGRMSAKWQEHYDKWHPECERSGKSSVARLEDIELKLEDLE